ncbi:hypothetical protein [Halorarius litoreus]|uniref:hypothetical protein n=1 Tax=Halorarius litoreus TaxID=2962676 RepID=UPI0020CF0964|nr:hypothetical protein [Halorarius litoreus]
MSSDADGRGAVAGSRYTLTERNTFGFLPGPMTGVSCPSCFKDQLLRDIITEGTCKHCGASLELTLSVTD